MPEFVFSDDLEGKIFTCGERLITSTRQYAEANRINNPWLEHFLEKTMEDDQFRVQALRFVDVMPQLDDNQDLVKHLEEYFNKDDLPLTGLLKFGLRYTGSSIGNTLLAQSIRKVIRILALRFMGGANANDAIEAARQLHEKNIGFSLDLLGEAVVSENEAEEYLDKYLQLLLELPDKLNSWPNSDQAHTPQLNLSLKLSCLYSQISPLDPKGSIEGISRRLRPLMSAARESHAFVLIDMEQYEYKNIIIDCFKSLMMEDQFRDWSDTGIAMQAYLRDTENDLQELIEWTHERGTPITVRLVRGAYWDYETVIAKQNGWDSPVWAEKHQTDACYERCLNLLFNNLVDNNPAPIRPAIATHNLRSMAVAMTLAEELGIPSDAFEFQMLYGMARATEEVIPQSGHALRIYTPFGELLPGMAYLVRRLLENSSSQSFQRLKISSSRNKEQNIDGLLQSPHLIASNEANESNETRQKDIFSNEPLHRFIQSKQHEHFAQSIKDVRSELGEEYPLIIDGNEVTTGHCLTSINPSNTEEVIGKVSMASREEAQHAIEAAKKAFQGWSALSLTERAEYLFRTAEKLREQRDEFAALEIFEAGKTWAEADANITEAIDFLDYYARQAIKLDNTATLKIPGETNHSLYRPQGVAAIIPPWNFPLAILTGMLSAAIVAGNTAILKPSSETPVIAARFVRLLHEAGLPKNIVQFIPGPGSEVGEYLIQHPDIHVIAFTGSQSVGTRIMQLASQPTPSQIHIKHVIAEMGGKNAIIIDRDADLDEAVLGTTHSAFGYQGQKCSACSRVIVIGDHYDNFLKRLIDATASLKIGMPENPGINMGPVISQPAFHRINQNIIQGKEIAEAVLDKAAVKIDSGYFIGPVIFGDVHPDSPLAQNEIFGPVLSVIKAGDLDEAIAIANNSHYALTGGLYSRSPANIEQVVKEFQAGNLYINRGSTGARVGRQPFGGYKLSGTGSKAGGADYLKHFLTPITVTENTLRRGFAPEQ